MTDTIIFILAGAFATATPLLLAAIGEAVVEKTGVMNLSVEGMMAFAAAVAFGVTHQTGDIVLGFGLAVLASTALSLVFSVLVLGFSANQIVSGLAVGILGLGLSGLAGRHFENLTMIGPGNQSVPVLSDIPLLGPILFQQSVITYLAFAAAFLTWWFLGRTRQGRILKVVGEDPAIAHNLGFAVVRIRLFAIIFGAVMSGIAGAYASTILTPGWSDGLIAGRGWIAVALVVFGTWRPLRIAFGAYLFGALLLGDLAVQAMGFRIPSQIMTSLPYVMTIVVLAAVSRNALLIRLNAPVSLGQNYRPSK
ncbi:nucleoside ABC transporter membrane protein [Pseudooceanicola nitratireducens]|jgi:simple sugar transport system permease protein|uniref:Nucleoside ABC transporter membrane protein n=1 Tax=Pseudooceanicola nitratireducens TaxID=517719 RepID=A0A1I1QS95_9RHOB|nr:ABC transporter permease [Pseudooceanicola nitratireducens]SEJ76614.1 simple sugar transport system permease protein [Pseudooceanicola nitratireducens]SFD24996.1 nucleoside ABC transporter membrane protein [Pseudooceanicola nitratireducens]